MKCRCGHDIRVTHSYVIDGFTKTTRAECPKCFRTYTIVSQVIEENPERGKGAFALAKKWKERGLKLVFSRPV